jgi:putative adhesin
MIPRATLIAALVGVEMALVFGMVVSVGGGPAGRHGRHGGPAAGAASLEAPSTFPAGNRPALAVDVGMADVVIDAVQSRRIDVSVSDSDMHVGSSAPIIVRDDGGTIRITASETDAWAFLGDSRTVRVSVPPATAVVITQAGNVTASGLRADATINSGAHFHPDDGITVRDFRGSLTATTSNGNLDLIDADCPQLHVTSANGRVTLTRVQARQIDASSSNGRVNGTGLRLHDGRVATSNGRVSLGFAPGADTTITAASSNGRVNVSGLSAGSGAQQVRSTGEDGDSLPAKMVRIGAGSGRLDVRTSNGSIDLSQEG